MPDTKCLLWDFGDTLCDERFIWNSGPEWLSAYDTFDDGCGAAWNLGDIDTAAFADELARQLPLDSAAIVRHMVACSARIGFFEYTYAYFKARHLPQAIVTVNPDLFSDVIVPLHQLDTFADTIVTSWQERTTDKRILCQLALERMGLDCDSSQALLIDNKQANLDDWAKHGGAGYLYTTDDAFRRDVQDGVLAPISF